MPRATLRPAVPGDIPLILDLIRELADYEKLVHEVKADAQRMHDHLFGPRPFAEVLIGEVDGTPQGFALFFHNYSTWLSQPGIYLEDLYVRPAARGAGLGKALLTELARLAVERGCGRLEWSVLDWNAPSIAFYDGLGAASMDEWIIRRLTGENIRKLAGLF